MILFVAMCFTALSITLADDFHASILMQAAMKNEPNKAERSADYNTSQLAFQQTDLDGNGHITVEELIQFVENTSGITVDGYLRQGFGIVISRADTDGNGTIEPNEYSELLKSEIY